MYVCMDGIASFVSVESRLRIGVHSYQVKSLYFTVYIYILYIYTYISVASPNRLYTESKLYLSIKERDSVHVFIDSVYEHTIYHIFTIDTSIQSEVLFHRSLNRSYNTHVFITYHYCCLAENFHVHRDRASA